MVGSGGGQNVHSVCSANETEEGAAWTEGPRDDEGEEEEPGIWKGGQRFARPHADFQYLHVDDLGGDEWLGDGTIPAGSNGEELRRSVPKADAELRRLRTESVTLPITALRGGDRASEPNMTAALASRKVEKKELLRQLRDWMSVVVADSGCGVTMLTEADGLKWRTRGMKQIKYAVANGQIEIGYGGEPLDVAIMDDHGVWRVKRVGPAFVCKNASSTLLSLGKAAEHDLGTVIEPGGAYLFDAEHRYPMEMMGDTYKVTMHIMPVGHEFEVGSEVDESTLSTTMAASAQVNRGDSTDGGTGPLVEALAAMQATFEAAVDETVEMMIHHTATEAKGASAEQRKHDLVKRVEVDRDDDSGDSGGSAANVDEVMKTWIGEMKAWAMAMPSGLTFEIGGHGAKVVDRNGRVAHELKMDPLTQDALWAALKEESERLKWVDKMRNWVAAVPSGLVFEIQERGMKVRERNGRTAHELKMDPFKRNALWTALKEESAKRKLGGSSVKKVASANGRRRVIVRKQKKKAVTVAAAVEIKVIGEKVKIEVDGKVVGEIGGKSSAGGKVNVLRKTAVKKTVARVMFMRAQHELLGHIGATRLNEMRARGEFGDNGCYVTTEDLKCDGCGISGTQNARRSREHERVKSLVVFHTWIWDVHYAPKEAAGSKNPEGHKWTFGFVDEATGVEFVYHSADRKANDCLRAMKALQAFVLREAANVHRKWGYVPKIGVLKSDVDAAAATTNGYHAGIVEAWMKKEGISRDLSLSKSAHKHAAIESMWKRMFKRSLASLASAGMRTGWWFYAVDHYVFGSNHTTGSDANHLGGRSETPCETAGMKDQRKRKRRFGSACWWRSEDDLNFEGKSVSNKSGKAKGLRRGVRAIFVGYGDDVQGYKIILLVSKKMRCSLNVYIPTNGLTTTMDFVRSIREDPFVAGLAGRWVWGLFDKHVKAQTAVEPVTRADGELADWIDDEGHAVMVPPPTPEEYGERVRREDVADELDDAGRPIERPAVNGDDARDDERVVQDDERVVQGDERVVQDDERVVQDDERVVQDDERVVQDDERVVQDDERVVQDGEHADDGRACDDDVETNESSVRRDGDPSRVGDQKSDDDGDAEGHRREHESSNGSVNGSGGSSDGGSSGSSDGGSGGSSNGDSGGSSSGSGGSSDGDSGGSSIGSGGSSGLDPDADAFEPIGFTRFTSRTVGTSSGRSDDALWPRGQPIPNGASRGSRRTKEFDDGTGGRKFGTEMSGKEARKLARKARKEHLDVVFDPNHTKGGRKQRTSMSKERYERYRRLTKMEDILKAENEPMTYSWESGPTDTVMRNGKNKFGKSGDDLAFDIEHGIAMIKDGNGGFLRAALAKKAAPTRAAVQELQAQGVLPIQEDPIEKGIEWAKKSGIDAERDGAKELPGWLASACAAKVQLMVDGMKEPMTVEEAMDLPEWKMWQEAIEKEVSGLVKIGTWEEVDESVPAARKKKILPSKLVLTLKTREEGGVMVLDKVKARLVGGGHKSVAGRDHFETAAYMAMSKSVKMMLALATSSGAEVITHDISQAFLLSGELEEGEEIYMQLPKLLTEGGRDAPETYQGCGAGRGHGKCARLLRYLYGLPQSSRRWMQTLNKFFYSLNDGKDSRCRATVSDRCVFRWEWKGHCLNAAVHVDDIISTPSSPEIREEFGRRLRAYFGDDKVTGGEPADYVLGMRIDRDRAKKTLTISQGGFVRKLLEKFGVEENTKAKVQPLTAGIRLKRYEGQASKDDIYWFMTAVGSFQWLACCSRPDVAYAAGLLGRHTANPSPEAMAEVKHVLEYLAGTADLGITYHGSDEVLGMNKNKLIASVDSDLGGCGVDQKSTSGFVVMLNGGAISWKSRKQGVTSTSTMMSEMIAADLCGMEVTFLRDLMGEFGWRQGCVRVMEDNAGCVQVAHGQRDSPKTQGFRRTQVSVEEYCNRGVMWLDDVPGEQNWSDIFTKSMKDSVGFRRLRDVVMGVTPEVYISRGVSAMMRTGVNPGANKLLRDVAAWLASDEP